MRTKEVAKLAGVSVRTLHHYDAVGLVCPRRSGENGYRDYTDTDLDRLQQVLLYRACGFPLGTIRQLAEQGVLGSERSLRLQRDMLMHERQRLDGMLATLDAMLAAQKGERTMSREEKFAGFDFSRNPYEEEARRLYGDEAVDKADAAVRKMTPEGRNEMQESMNTLFARLATLRAGAPEAPEAQQAVAQWYQLLNSFGYHYSPEAFAGLGQLYTEDERFTKNIDRFGEGLADFLMRAMAHYAAGLPPE